MDAMTGGPPVPTGGRRWLPVGTLVVAQGLDVASTLYGLRSAPLVELNPVAAAAMASLGPFLGLFCLACVATLAAVVVTETATRRYGDTVLAAGQLRWLGYAPHVSISVAAALNNLVVASVV